MILVMGLMMLPAMAVAATIHVPADQPTIQAGIDAATDGDTILVASGNYSVNLAITGKGIALISESGSDATTLTPAVTSGVIIYYGNNLGKTNTVKGFTLTGAQGPRCIESGSGSLIVEENEFKDNLVNGGALWMSGTCLVRYNKFLNNHGNGWAGAIGGDHLTSSRIELNEFRDNAAANGAGIDLYNSSTVVRYNLFVSNKAQNWGGAITVHDGSNHVLISNNTIDSCISSSSKGGGISLVSCNADSFFNNIILHCSGYGIWQQSSSGYVTAYSDAYSNSPANYYGIGPSTGSISADPQFVGGTQLDYHLKSTSPCIDAGNPDPKYNDPDGTRNDMGVLYYDRSYPWALNVGIIGQPLDSVTVHIPMFSWSYRDGGSSTQAKYLIEIGNDTDWVAAEMWNSGEVTSSDTMAMYSGTPFSIDSRYYGRIRVNNGTTWGRWTVFQFMMHPSPVIHVPADQPTIQAGINAAVNGDTVLVAPGIYYELDVSLKGKAITLTSNYIFDQDTNTIANTVLGDSSLNWHFSQYPRLRCASGEGPSTIINGFTVQGKHGGIDIANSSPTITNNRFYCLKRMESGGGMLAVNSGSLVKDNRFTCVISDGNIGGGGIGASNSPLEIMDCDFIDCQGDYGTGIALSACSNVRIARCTFRRNSGYHGLAVLVQNSPLVSIDSCRFENNLNSGRVVEGDFLSVVNINNSTFANESIITESAAIWGVHGRFASDSISGFYWGINGQGGKVSVFSSIVANNVIGIKAGSLDTTSVINSSFIGNSQYGIAVDIGTLTVDSCMLKRNGEGISCFGAQGVRVRRSVLIDNGISTGYTSDGVYLSNNTLFGGSFLLQEGHGIVENNIVIGGVNLVQPKTSLDTLVFRFNDISGIVSPYAFLGDTTWGHNTIVIPCDSLQNIFRDPEFSDTSAGDFTLGRTSPCIDAGNPDPALNDPDGTRNDMGAFYCTNAAPTAPRLVEPPNTTIVPTATLRPQFVWRLSISHDPHDTITYLLAIALDSNFTFVQQIPDLTDTSHTLTTELLWGKNYWWKVKSVDKHGNEIWSPQVFTFRTVTLGDCDNDAAVTVADVVFLINYIFMGGGAPQPLMTGDPNCDGSIDIADAVYLINYIFSHGPAPCSAF